jgi:hypothetical protein
MQAARHNDIPFSSEGKLLFLVDGPQRGTDHLGAQQQIQDSSTRLFAADASEDGAVGEGEKGTGETGSASLAGELQAAGMVPRCRTRALAVACLRDILRATTTSPASASTPSPSGQSRAAVEWLADLVAIGFTAATAPVHTLRPHGLGLLSDVILVCMMTSPLHSLSLSLVCASPSLRALAVVC